jgi:hypothetical protein
MLHIDTPYVSADEYMWKITSPLVRVAISKIFQDIFKPITVEPFIMDVDISRFLIRPNPIWTEAKTKRRIFKPRIALNSSSNINEYPDSFKEREIRRSIK